LALSQRVDVNGKKIGRDVVSMMGTIQGADDNSLVELAFDDNRVVTMVDIEKLPKNPAFADTEEEYRRTGLYEALKMIYGDDCATLTPQAAYRFFQNRIKPTIIHEPEKTEWTDTGVSRTSFDKAVDVPFCGRSLSFTSLQGYNTEDITLDNPHGAFVFSGISVK